LEEEENGRKAFNPLAASWTRTDAGTFLEHLEHLNNAKAAGAAAASDAQEDEAGMNVDDDEEARQEQEEDDDHASQAKKAAEKHVQIARDFGLNTLGSVHRLVQVLDEQDSQLLSWAAQQYLSLVVAKDKSQLEDFRNQHPEVGIWVLPWVKRHIPRDAFANVEGAQRLADLCVVSDDDVVGDDDQDCTRTLINSIFGDDLVFDKEVDMIAFRSSLADDADVPTLYSRDKDSRLLHNGRLESCASERIPLRFRTHAPPPPQEAKEL
jgi:hypothetical protein